MIDVKVHARNPDAVFSSLVVREPRNTAIGRLVFELSHGEVVTALSQISLTVEEGFTDSFSVFSGSSDDMASLLSIAYFSQRTSGPLRQIIECVSKEAGYEHNAMQAQDSMDVPHLDGDARLKIAYMFAMGVTEEDDICFGSLLPFDDLSLLLTLFVKYKGESLLHVSAYRR